MLNIILDNNSGCLIGNHKDGEVVNWMGVSGLTVKPLPERDRKAADWLVFVVEWPALLGLQRTLLYLLRGKMFYAIRINLSTNVVSYPRGSNPGPLSQSQGFGITGGQPRDPGIKPGVRI